MQGVTGSIGLAGQGRPIRSLVVLTPVEAAVNDSLDATPGLLEQGGHGKRGPGHGQARPLRQQPPNPSTTAA
jgi:hypothetical protein